MRVIVATIVGLAALAASSTQTAAAPSKAYSSARLHETPAENVRKSQWYDHLLSTNPRFRAYRIRKEATRSPMIPSCAATASGPSMFIRPSGWDLDAAVSAVDDVFDHGRPVDLLGGGLDRTARYQGRAFPK
jgi:hypothetical protein